MGLFSFAKALIPRTGVSKKSPSKASSAQDISAQEALALYKRLRPTRLDLNNRLAGGLSGDVIEEGARRIGLFHRGTIVFDTENEMSVLMDY